MQPAGKKLSNKVKDISLSYSGQILDQQTFYFTDKKSAPEIV